ncbi:MAG TPA: DNA translocase FtsK 4TM domain-containing protein [Candidatus Krumholzibacteria bacterium]|nr:DNA translocase FtsK 4TM domain-containing protein [Candidatus Krumholzibacteria bacterium]
MTDRARVFLTITLLAVALFVGVGLGSVSDFDWPFTSSAPIFHVSNLTGPFGSAVAFIVVRLFGSLLAWMVPVLLIGVGIALARDAEAPVRRVAVKGLVAVVLLNAFFAVSPVTRDLASLRGWIGDGVASGLCAVFGEVGSAIVLVAAVLLIALGEAHILHWAGGVAGGAGTRARAAMSALRESMARRRAVISDYVHSAVERSAGDDEDAGDALREEDAEAEGEAPGAALAAEAWEEPAASRKARRREPEIAIAELRPRPEAKPKAKKRAPAGDGEEPTVPVVDAALPPLSILEQPVESERTFTRDDLRNWSGVLEEKLNQFGVAGKVTAVHHGPVVTTFEFEPAPGVRIKDIVSRSDDLALAMRARSIRLIAPIPGRAVVGIEMPNPHARTVYLYEVLSEVTEAQRLKGVMIGMGVDVVGKPFLMNLCEAPHLLIAGTTGSGKSVCLNALLASILLHYRPSDVQLLLVDPKMVEMSQYNGIPHLLHPVITDPKEAARVLEFLVGEMGRRNELFRRNGVRNLESYNAKVAMEKKDDPAIERLPYIVLVVDELGDLALAKGVDIESLLTRLAQMARAAGIHMVLATQRPSVDVIVGKTKANFPTRIAFRVATKVDSRTILDTIGADKLLGKGDMLYLDAHHAQPLRLHGAWVSEPEIEHLIEHWKAYRFEPSTLDLAEGRAGSAEAGVDLDPLFDDARGIVTMYKQGSTSLLQRKLHVGYSRAARLLDQLEQHGIVGPPDGSKPREVYLDARTPE